MYTDRCGNVVNGDQIKETKNKAAKKTKVSIPVEKAEKKEVKKETVAEKKTVKAAQKPKTEKKAEKEEKKTVKKEDKADTPVKEKKKPGRKPKNLNV